MKVFLYCHTMTYGFGGMERTVATLANYLVTQNNKVAIGFSSVNAKKGNSSYFLHNDIVMLDWDSKNKASLLAKIYSFSPDVIIIFGAGRQTAYITSIMRMLDIPIIIHEGTNPERCISVNWMNKEITRSLALWQREMAYFEAKYIRFTIDTYKDSLSSIFSEKTVAFPNAFERIENKNEQIEKSKNRIINIGGLKEHKNIFPLLKAFAKISSDFPNWELAIFSHTPHRSSEFINKIYKFIRDSRLESQIIIYPPTESIHLEYKKSDIHAIMSESEGLPNAVAESMIYGIPSIGFAHCPGVSFLIHHGEDGFLIEKDADEMLTVNRIVDTLRILMSDEKLRMQMGQCALKNSSIFNPQYIYQKWINIINKCQQKTLFYQEKQLSEQEREVLLHYARRREQFWDEMLSDAQCKKQIKLMKAILRSDKSFFEKKEEMANGQIAQFRFF